jgi:glycosyltransferase involved in cell wall biosynthesis
VRVLIAHSFYRIPGGEDRYVRQQAALLGDHHQVHVVERRNEELRTGPSTAAHMIYSRRERRRVENSVGSFSPDLIHVHNVYPSLGPAVHLAAQRHRIPLVMTVHNFRLRCPNGYMFTEGQLCRRCERGNYSHAIAHHCFPTGSQSAAYATTLWLHRWILRLEDNVNLFIVPSNFMRDRLVTWGFAEAQIKLIRNFTDISPAESVEVGSFGMYLGRLSREKGLDVLLEALRKAGDPPFWFVGDGPLRVDLENLSQEQGLMNARFLGRVDSDVVRSLLRQCRFLAMPSLCDENAPLAALEALGAGRPLLATRVGGLPELAGGGRGLLCEAGNADELAEGINTLMRDEQLCREAGAHASSFARAELSPAVHLNGLEAAYEAVTGGRTS